MVGVPIVPVFQVALQVTLLMPALGLEMLPVAVFGGVEIMVCNCDVFYSSSILRKVN